MLTILDLSASQRDTAAGGSRIEERFHLTGITPTGSLEDHPFAGLFQDIPLLPSSMDRDNNILTFLNVASGLWFDPPTASEYRYETTDGALFTKILELPTGFSVGSVSAPSCGDLGPFDGGQSVDFTKCSLAGVSEFTTSGINPLFDPDDPTAFPVKLAFNTSTASFTAQAFSPTDIPEPTTLLVLAASAIPLGVIRRRRVRGVAVSAKRAH